MSVADQVAALNRSLDAKRAEVTVDMVHRRLLGEWALFAAENQGKTAAEQVLAFMDARNHSLQADAAFLAGAPETGGVETIDLGRVELDHLDRARREVLLKVEKELRSAVARKQAWPSNGQLPGPAATLYAVVRSYNGRSEYAALAERETGAFLSMLAEHFRLPDFYDITARSRKSVTQPGPDGIFAGAASLFGLTRNFVGLEVKTIVSDSFGNVMKTLKGRYVEKPMDFRLDTQKRGKARLAVIIEEHPNPAERQRAARMQAALEAEVANKIGTMLVVRNVGFSAMKIEPWAYEAFDLVLTFDLWGRIDWVTSRRQKRQIHDLRPRLEKLNNDWLDARARAYMRQLGMDLVQLAKP